MEGHPIPAPAEIKRTPIQRGYDAFSAFQERLAVNVLARSPQEIAQIASGETPLDPFIEEMLPKNNPQLVLRGERGVQAASFLRTYAQRESAIQNWWEENTANRTEMQQKREILALTKYAKEHEISDEVLEKVTLTRIHGGIGFVIEDLALMRQLGIVAAEEVYKKAETTENPLSLQTTKVTDPEQVDEALRQQGEIGFVLDDSELALPEGLAGMKIVFGTKNAMAHEEAEILGMYMDEAMEGMKGLKHLSEQKATEQSAFQPTEQTRLALFDMAARLEEGTSDLNLPLLGITPAYAQSHEQEAKLLAIALEHVQQKVQEARENGLSPEEVKTQLAHEIRGAIIHPESLISLWHPDASAEEILSQQHLTPEHFLGAQDESYAFTSERKGRFVYYEATLEKYNPGDPIVEQRNAITINGTQYKIIDKGGGGQGRVYVGEAPSGQKILLKEQIFNSPDWVGYVFDETRTPQQAKDLLEVWKREKQAQSQQPDPFEFVRLLENMAYNARGEFDQDLKTAFQTHLANIQIGGIPLWDPRVLSLNPMLQLTAPEVQAELSKIEDAIIEGLVAFSQKHQRPQKMNEADLDLYREGLFLNLLTGTPGIPQFVGLVTGDRGKKKTDLHYQHHYLAMEYVEGQSLQEFRKNSPPTPEMALDFTGQLCQILTDVHAKGITFRDVKPANIMVRPTGEIVLVDFGVAFAEPGSVADQLIHPTSPLPTPLQGATYETPDYNSAIGTPGYAAPEQYIRPTIPQGHLTPATDIHAIGVMLYELLVQDPNVNKKGAPPEQTIRQRLQSKGVSAEATNIVIRSLKKDAADRYHTTADMLADITAALGHQVTPVTPPNPVRAAAATQQLTQPIPMPPTAHLPSPRQQVQPLIRSLDHLNYTLPVQSLQAVPMQVRQTLGQIGAMPTEEAMEALDIFGSKGRWRNSPDMRDMAPLLATQQARAIIAQARTLNVVPQPEAYGRWGKLVARSFDNTPTRVRIMPKELDTEAQAFFTALKEAVDTKPDMTGSLLQQLSPLLRDPWLTKGKPEMRRQFNVTLAEIVQIAQAKGIPVEETWLHTLEEAFTTTQYPGVTSSYRLPQDVQIYRNIVQNLAIDPSWKPILTRRLQNLVSTSAGWTDRNLSRVLSPVFMYTASQL